MSWNSLIHECPCIIFIEISLPQMSSDARRRVMWAPPVKPFSRKEDTCRERLVHSGIVLSIGCVSHDRTNHLSAWRSANKECKPGVISWNVFRNGIMFRNAMDVAVWWFWWFGENRRWCGWNIAVKCDGLLRLMERCRERTMSSECKHDGLTDQQRWLNDKRDDLRGSMA